MVDDIEKKTNEDKPEVTEESGEEKKKKKKKKKRKKAKKVHPKGTEPKLVKILIRVLIVTVIVLAEVAISYTLVTKFLMQDDTEEDIADQDVPDDEGTKAEEKKEDDHEDQIQSDESTIDYSKEIQVVTLSDIVVNPAFSSGKHFLAMSIVLALDDEEVAGRVSEREPMLRDGFLTLLSQKSYSWLSNFENREVLRAEILNIAKEILQCSGGVYVYFTKYVLQ